MAKAPVAGSNLHSSCCDASENQRLPFPSKIMNQIHARWCGVGMGNVFMVALEGEYTARASRLSSANQTLPDLSAATPSG